MLGPYEVLGPGLSAHTSSQSPGSYPDEACITPLYREDGWLRDHRHRAGRRSRNVTPGSQIQKLLAVLSHCLMAWKESGGAPRAPHTALKATLQEPERWRERLCRERVLCRNTVYSNDRQEVEAAAGG